MNTALEIQPTFYEYISDFFLNCEMIHSIDTALTTFGGNVQTR